MAALSKENHELRENAAEKRRRLDEETGRELLRLQREVERLKNEANTVAPGRRTPDVVD